jgi:hypothetical protein
MLVDPKDVIGIVLFIILPFAFAGIYLPQWAANIASGRKLSYLGCLTFFLGPVIAVVIFYVGLFFPFGPIVNSSLQHYRFSEYTLAVTITPFMLNITIRELLRRFRLKDDAIIEVGRNEIKLNYNLVIGIGGLIYFGYTLFSALLEQGSADFVTVFGIEFYLAAVAFALIIITRKKHLTREGISQFLATTKWDSFNSYRWGRPADDKIDLAFHRKNGGELKLTVPLSKKEQIDNHLHTWGQSHLKLPLARIVEGVGS